MRCWARRGRRWWVKRSQRETRDDVRRARCVNFVLELVFGCGEWRRERKRVVGGCRPPSPPLPAAPTSPSSSTCSGTPGGGKLHPPTPTTSTSAGCASYGCMSAALRNVVRLYAVAALTAPHTVALR